MNPSEHEWAWELLAEYAGGGLSADEAARLEVHVATCDECTAALDELRQGELPVGERVAEPKKRKGFRDRVVGRLRRGARKQPPTAMSRGLVVAAVLALLGVVGFVISEMEPDRKERVHESESPIIVAKRAAPMDMERPRDLFERRGVPGDDRVSQPTDEPAIFFPEAKESDHNESADNEDHHQMKGDSKEFLSYIKGEAGGLRGRQAGRPPGVYDTMGVGVGGGGGGRYGGRFGGRSVDPVKPAEAPGYFRPNDELAAARANEETAARARRAQDQIGPSPRPVAPGGSPQGQEELPKPQRKVIRSGEMEFEIDSFDTAVATLAKIAVEEQGLIATVNSEKLLNGKVRGTVVVRVPPDNLDRLLLKLRAMGELKSQRIGSEDVTKRYADLEGRLRAARTMEERLIAIIKEGKGQIKDLLQAEKELGEWRTKIETAVGEINYYNNLVSLSTLTVTLYEKEIRAPFAILETERVEMAVEVEDVEKAHREALAAIAEAKGRVTKSDLKQLGAGQFNAIVHLEIAPAQAGTLRDRLKLLGVVARLDITRAQETQGGTGKAQEARVQQNDTVMLVSLYNLVNLAPRETVHLSLASVDAEKSYRAILERVERAGGRMLSSRLSRPRSDQTSGTLVFQIRSAEAEAVLHDVREAGEVMKLDVTEDPDTGNATRSKRGFNVSVWSMGSVQARETSTVVLASKDVAVGYRALLQAVNAASGRVINAQLNENDVKNVTATLSVEVRREQEEAVAAAMARAGDVYTRTSTRAQEGENVVDSKVLLNVRLFNVAGIPARETVKISVSVGDVEAAAGALEAEFKARVVDARHSRESSGQKESSFTIDVPLSGMKAAVERIKGLGRLREHGATKNTGVPENALAVARLEVRVSDEILVAQDSGPAANVKRGLAISLQAASWALMLIMIGVCFVLPLALVIWASFRIHRKLRPKVEPVAPAA